MASIVLVGGCFLAYEARKSYKAHKAEKLSKNYANSAHGSSQPQLPAYTASDSAVYNVGAYNSTAFGKLPDYGEVTSQPAPTRDFASSSHRREVNGSSSAATS